MRQLVGIQRRMMELGRVRLGEKGAKGEPKRLNTFRFTSASKALLEAVAAQHGGKVRDWKGAPDEGYFEVTTKATQLDIVIPPVFAASDGSPTVPWSQFYELWSGGGCLRRCDGQTEALSGKPCMCDLDKPECKLTTRVSFMLPDIPSLGVWRLESHGWNAAVELPGTLEVLTLAAAEQKFIPAVLRIEHRTKKVPGEGTRRFVVPVIDLPGVTLKQLTGGELPTLNAPMPAGASQQPPAVSISTQPRVPKPELPAAPDLPEPKFEGDPDFGEAPVVDPSSPPNSASLRVDGGQATGEDASPGPSPAPTLSPAKKRKLEALIGSTAKLSNHEHEAMRHIAKRASGVASLNDLTDAQADELIERLETYETNLQAEQQTQFPIPEGARK